MCQTWTLVYRSSKQIGLSKHTHQPKYWGDISSSVLPPHALGKTVPFCPLSLCLKNYCYFWFLFTWPILRLLLFRPVTPRSPKNLLCLWCESLQAGCHSCKQEAQLMLTTGSTRLAVSRGQQTWYHSTCYI